MTHILRFLIAAIGLIPIPIRTRIGAALGWVFSWIPTRDRRIAQLQLKCFLPPQLDPVAISDVYRSVGSSITEGLNLTPLINNMSQVVHTPHEDRIQDLLGRGKPIIAFTAHTGNWDLMAAYYVSRGLALSTVGRRARNQVLQDILTDIRSDYGIRTLWREDPSSTRELLRTLKRGEIVAALIDQDTTVTSLSVPFFGQPASTPSALAALGLRLGAVFASSFIFRTAPLRYEVVVDELIGDTPEELLHQYHQRLEHYLKQWPAQWVWFHKRWRTLPSGQRMSSRQYLTWLTEQASHA